MNHYICTGGCDGEAPKQGVCQAEGCAKEGEPLTPCACTDGGHTLPEKAEEESEIS